MSKHTLPHKSLLKLDGFVSSSKTTDQFILVIKCSSSGHFGEAQGLYLFFLPAYCSEMNRIESEWHQLKTHELAGQMFEDELDLAYAVMDGVEARSQVEGRTTQRFKFQSS